MGFGTITFTSRGRALQAKATADTELHFNRISVGDGQLSGQAVDELTSLIHEVKSIAINELRVLSGNKAKIGGVLSNQGLATGFYWRELGVYAQDPDLGEILYCYGNAGALAEYIPAQGGSEILEKQVNVIAIVGSAANITATIDQSLVYATKQELNDKISHSLATAAGDFLVASKAGQFVKKTLAEIKALLGLGTAAYKNFDSAGGVAAYDTVNAHLSDYVRQPGYGVTSGSANTYTLTLSPAPAAYVDGMGIVVKINAANTGASTINVNGLGAKAIVDGKGNALAAAKLRLNGTYSLKYNSTSGNFILQGEGGEIPKLPNLIKNGSFELDLNHWSYENMSIEFSSAWPKQGGKCLLFSVPSTVPESFLYQAFYYKQNHKYYVCGWALGNKAFTIDVFLSIASPPYPSTLGMPNSGNSVWQFFSGVVAGTTQATGWQSFRLDINNGSQGVWGALDGIMVFDLTEAYGAGNEPTKEELDVAVQNLGWWDSDLELLTVDGTANKYHGIQGTVYYSKGERIVGEIPNRTFEATGGAYTPAISFKPDGPGVSLLVQPQNGYYVNQVNAGGFGPIIVSDPNFIPSNIVSGKSIFGLAGSFQGKNWASGTVTSSATSPLFLSFLEQGGYLPTVTVSGLSFLPKFIYVRYNSGGVAPIQYTTVYDAYANTARANSAMIQSFSGDIGVNNTTVRTINIVSGGGYVNLGGFCLPVLNSNTSYFWIAFE